MQNKLWVLVLFSLIWGINSVQGSAPGPDDWRDQNGHAAPPAVRKAADGLWQAVEIEGKAKFEAGFCIRRRANDTCSYDKFPRLVVAILTCGITCCTCPDCGIQDHELYDKFGWAKFVGDRDDMKIYEQRQKQTKEALTRFHEAVNQSVKSPEEYSGDANICQLGPYVEDGAWTMTDGRYRSGRHDLSGVTKATKHFVDSHGGWKDAEKSVH